MHTFALGGKVTTPALLPITVGTHSPELQHCLGSVERPPSTGDVEPVPDEVPASNMAWSCQPRRVPGVNTPWFKVTELVPRHTPLGMFERVLWGLVASAGDAGGAWVARRRSTSPRSAPQLEKPCSRATTSCAAERLTRSETPWTRWSAATSPDWAERNSSRAWRRS